MRKKRTLKQFTAWMLLFVFVLCGSMSQCAMAESGAVEESSRKANPRQYSVIKLKIVEVIDGESVVGKCGKDKYMLNKSQAVGILNKNGKKVPFSRLKKGKMVKVYHDGMILESYPAQFAKIYKVKLIK